MHIPYAYSSLSSSVDKEHYGSYVIATYLYNYVIFGLPV